MAKKQTIEIGRHLVRKDDAPESRAGINGRLNSLVGQAQKLAREMGGAFVEITVTYEGSKKPGQFLKEIETAKN